MQTYLLFGLAAAVAAASFQEPLPFNQRPASVTVVLAKSHNLYDGTFTAKSTAAVCGVVPKDRNFTGEDAFIVQFPDDADLEVTDVTFSSKELVGKVTTTSKFFLSVTVKSPRIGSPSAYVLDPSQPQVSGKATLISTAAGAHELKIEGVNQLGATLTFTMTCSPRPRG
jgi:hypothetical protein